MKWKHILCLFGAVLALGMCPVSGRAAQTAEISDPAGLRAIASDPYGSYRLTADLDLSGENWTPIPFFGELDGGGHGIYNLTVRRSGADTALSVDGNALSYETFFAGLFSVTRQAKIRNLNLVGVDVSLAPQGSCFAAGLAGYVEETTLENCSVSGRIALYGKGNMVGVGGLAGFGKGNFRDCRADVELLFEDRSEGVRCEQFMGGVLATGLGSMQGCTVKIAGFDSCNGYVHNGGLAGMYYASGFAYQGLQVTNCSVAGKITFYENNPDRRAYCDGLFGELLTYPAWMEGNSADFLRDERFEYDTPLRPEACPDPSYQQTVLPPSCTAWGYTEHSCTVCGYAWTDTYTPPAHVPGPWETTLEPSYSSSGSAQSQCTLCGETLGAQALPQKVPAAQCQITPEILALHYRQTSRLHAQVLPADAADTAVVWSSSDPEVATVTQEGEVRAVHPGQAVITCASRDGFAQAQCPVEVRYSIGQWLILIFLFGWIWY